VSVARKRVTEYKLLKFACKGAGDKGECKWRDGYGGTAGVVEAIYSTCVLGGCSAEGKLLGYCFAI